MDSSGILSPSKLSKIVPVDAELPGLPVIPSHVPQNQLLSYVLAAVDEGELRSHFTRLRDMLKAAQSDTAVDQVLTTRGLKKPKKPTDIPKKEFLNRCRAHREQYLYAWSRAVRKAYQECLDLIDAQSGNANPRVKARK